MKQKLPPLTNDLLEAFAASAELWLIWLLGVLVKLPLARCSRTLHRLVETLERAVENILFLRAVRRFGPPPQRRSFPRGAPAGFRRIAHPRLRLFFRNANIRARKASLSQRVAHLFAALANPEPHIAYFYRRLSRGLRGARLVASAPPAHALAADAPRDAILADSS